MGRFSVGFAAEAPSFMVDGAAGAATRSAASSVAVTFDETAYLARFPDVGRLIATGDFADAEEHWLTVGARDGRSGRHVLLANRDFAAYCAELDAAEPFDFTLVIVADFTESDSGLLRGLLLQSERCFRLLLVAENYRRDEAEAAARAYGVVDRLVGIVAPDNLVDKVRALADMGDADWFVFLDDDVEPVPDAVRIVRKMRDDVAEGCSAVYFDEGFIDVTGERVSVRKPAWSPVYFMASGYACGFVLFAPAFLRDALSTTRGDAPLPFELLLHAIGQGSAVGHAHDVITWSGPDRFRSAEVDECLRRGVGEYLARLAPELSQSPRRDHLYLPVLTAKRPARVSVIIPTADRDVYVAGRLTNLLDQCIASLSACDADVDKEFIVVHNDDMGEARRADLIARGCRLVLFDATEFNFSRKINLGVAAASHDLLLLMNDDVLARDSWIGEASAYLAMSTVGAVGARLLFPDGSLQHGGCSIFRGSPLHIMYLMPEGGLGSYAGVVASIREVASVTAACMLTTRQAFESVGGFDEALPDLYNDADYCLRVRETGRSIVYLGRATLYHLESVSLDPARIHGDQQQLFEAKWGQGDRLDPYYNLATSRWRPYRWEPPAATGATDPWAEFGSPVGQ